MPSFIVAGAPGIDASSAAAPRGLFLDRIMYRPRLMQIENACWVSSLSLVLAVAFAPRLPGATVITGDVTPALPWSSSALPKIGNTGTGTLIVDAGSHVSSQFGYLGYNLGSTGVATLTGAGSTWSNSNDLYVGFSGSGSLRVEAGGQVSSSLSFLGLGSGSTGAATITGVGSKWTNSSALYVGHSGIGTLTVEDGGQVTAGTLYASLGDLHGDGTIAATIGAILDADMRFNAAHPAQSILGFGSAGTLTVTAAAGVLGAGYKGFGSLTISEGVAVSSSTGQLGYNSASTGTATITGAGSTWTVTSPVSVGVSGSGALRVEAGGHVNSFSGYLGSNTGSSGTATITGPGSKWTNSSALYVGDLGHGALTVEDGGQVTALTLYASPSDLHGNGAIAAAGAVLDADLQFNAEHLAQNTLRFGAGGLLTVTPGVGHLGAGYKGQGSLTVIEGAAVTSYGGFLGYKTGSTGTATISGAGSKWTNRGTFHVGVSGNGALRLEAGGQVSSVSSILSYDLGSTGTAVVAGIGSTWTNSSFLVVGSRRGGTLDVEAGGHVSNSYGSLGSGSGSTGTAKISGAGSAWTNSSYIVVGDRGNGALRVDAGGQVTNAAGYLGDDPGSAGTATISGLGSKWINNSDLYVGIFGSGALTITAGGLVSVRGTLTTDFSGGSDSFVNMATGGMLALYGDADDSLAQFLGLVNGADSIRYWDASLADWAPLTAATLGVDYTLQYRDAGDLAGYTLLSVLAPGPPGDFDGDGRVDGADLLAWQRGNSPTPNSPEDLATWTANFGLGAATPATTAVPEPDTVSLVGLASASLLQACRPTRGRKRPCPSGG